jgi:uncharacterized protein
MLAKEMPPEFWQGIEEFNQREFYACHDILEAIWMEAVDPEKSFYQGILQIAVGLYHLGNQNLRGAVILLGEGMNRLRHYQPEFGGIDVAELLAQSRALQAVLQQQLQQQASEPLVAPSESEIEAEAATCTETLVNLPPLPVVKPV